MTGQIFQAALRRLLTRQALLFLFFVALSAGFWLFLSLNDTYEEEFDLHLRLQNVPGEVVITDGLPPTMRVTLRDRGITLQGYRHGDTLPPVLIDFNAYANSAGHVRIPATDLLKQAQKRLASSTQIVSAKPDVVEYFYNRGRSKRVPVRHIGHIAAAPGFAVLSRRLSPDSVTVYATNAQLDTLSAVYAEPAYLRGITASETRVLKLLSMRGVKMIPAEVKLSVRADRLVEKRVSVPVTGANVPEGYSLRTFPPTVEVTFQVPMSQFRNITAADFAVTADCSALTPASTLCRLHLSKVPTAAQFARLQTEEVEYVLDKARP